MSFPFNSQGFSDKPKNYSVGHRNEQAYARDNPSARVFNGVLMPSFFVDDEPNIVDQVASLHFFAWEKGGTQQRDSLIEGLDPKPFFRLNRRPA